MFTFDQTDEIYHAPTPSLTETSWRVFDAMAPHVTMAFVVVVLGLCVFVAVG